MEVPPDDPDQPPGARNLVRIVLEALRVHQEALSAGDGLADELTPRLWSGEASHAFRDTGVPRLDAEWRTIAGIHREATDKVAGHLTFLENLVILWAGSADDPAERSRLSVLYQRATERLAEDILTFAARLGHAGHVEYGEPEPDPVSPTEPERHSPGVLEPTSTPDSDSAAAEPADPQPDQPEHTDDDDAHSDQTEADHAAGPAPSDPRWATAPFERWVMAGYRLREQVVAGDRRDHIPWTG